MQVFLLLANIIVAVSYQTEILLILFQKVFLITLHVGRVMEKTYSHSLK